MKKNYIFKSLLLLIPVSAFALMSLSSGRNGSYSSSPGDGNTCSACHSGGNFSASLNIDASSIPTSGYELGKEYTINVTQSSTSNRNGFQLTAEQTNNSKAGSFIAGSNSKVVNGNTHITHTNPNSKSWSVKWKAPTTNQGEIKFYAASVAGNGAGISGDQVVSATSESFNVLGISEAKRLNFEMFPNPTSDNLTIQLPSGAEEANVEFYDYVGRLALSKKITSSNNKIAVSNLSRGIYILKVISEDKIGSQKFVKN